MRFGSTPVTSSRIRVDELLICGGFIRKMLVGASGRKSWRTIPDAFYLFKLECCVPLSRERAILQSNTIFRGEYFAVCMSRNLRQQAKNGTAADFQEYDQFIY